MKPLQAFRSYLSAAAMSLAVLVSGCSHTTKFVSEQSKGYAPRWEKGKPLEKKVDSKITSAGTSSQHKLGSLDNLIFDYGGMGIRIPVMETVREDLTQIDSFVKYDNEVEMLGWAEIKYEITSPGHCNLEWKFFWGGAVASLAAGLSYTFMTDEPPGHQNHRGTGTNIALGVASGFLFFFPVGGLSHGAYEMTAHVLDCPDDKKYVETPRFGDGPTGKSRLVDIIKFDKKTPLPPRIYAEQPMSSGRASVSGRVFPSSTHTIQEGVLTVPFPPQSYPLFFAPNKESAVRNIDLSWIQEACRGDAVSFLQSATKDTTTPLTVETEAQEGIAGDTETYNLPVFQLPSRDEIVRYVIQARVNQRVTKASVTYLDLDNHFPITNVYLTFKPVRVLSPSELAGQCFSSPNDIATAQQYIPDYVRGEFSTRANGEHSFNVLVPSSFVIEAKHPSYRFRQDRIVFSAGALEHQVFMTELGSKTRVHVVPE